MSTPKPVVFLTGGTRGIGLAIARTLAQNGYRVAFTARNAADVQNLQNELRRLGAEALGICADIAQEQDVARAVSQCLNAFGAPDILINNAGIGLFKPLTGITTEEWDQVMNTNVRGSFLCIRACIPHFLAQSRGHIIQIASDVSRRTFTGGSLYCASKYAQEALISTVRKELRPAGIRVSCIYPGITRTRFDGQSDELPEKQWHMDPQVVANAVMYIASTPADTVVDELVLHPLQQDY